MESRPIPIGPVLFIENNALHWNIIAYIVVEECRQNSMRGGFMSKEYSVVRVTKATHKAALQLSEERGQTLIAYFRALVDADWCKTHVAGKRKKGAK